MFRVGDIVTIGLGGSESRWTVIRDDGNGWWGVRNVMHPTAQLSACASDMALVRRYQ